MKKIYLLLVLLFSIFTLSTDAQIIGDTAVCAGEVSVYHAPIVAGATYSWNPSGGTVAGASTLDSVTIQWGSAGTGTIIVTINNPNNTVTNYTLTVTIHPRPHPVISHVPYATCPTDTDRQGGTGLPQHGPVCQKVCKGATLSYSTPLHALSTYQWVVTGAAVVTGVNTNVIVVTWDTTAYGNIVVYETNQWGCTDSATICIEKLPLPKALFTSQTSVCKFSNVLFTNLSTGATSYQWTFGDGGTSTSFSPTHSYSAAGTYTITLIALTDCHCADTFSSSIHVDSMAGPAITCPSTLCPNQPATYTAASATGCVYHWLINGGTILSGQLTPTVNVQWGPGQIGSLGLYITGCNTVCTDTSWVYIPIVAANGTISGPAKVCPGDCEYYSLPLFSGATYHWSLRGSCGILQDSTCCEKVRICWPSYLFQCNDTLSVTYYDSILHCGGTASMIIRLRPKLDIQGDALVCANVISTYYSLGGISCNWYIAPNTPSLSPANPTSTLNINWNNIPGNYVITAIPANPNQVCNDSVKYNVTVVAPPPAPLFTGDTIICPGSSASYCAVGNGLLNWIVIGGTPSTAIGNCMTVNWGNSGPYLVQAYQQGTKAPFCNSDTTTQNVYAASVGPPALTGTLTACANATYTYATTTLYPAGTTYTWSLNLPNSGAILSPGSSSTQIQWGNNAPQNVTVTLSVSVCGVLKQNTMVVALNPAPAPSIAQIGSLCAGGAAQLQVSGGTYTYNWSGPSLYTSIVNPTIINLSGLYQVTVTDANNCTAVTQKNVTYVSSPTANISTSYNLHQCLGTVYSVNLCALGNANYTYAWSNFASTQCTTVSSPGSYVVTVTDGSTGCTALSNTLVVYEDSCNSIISPDTCSPNGSISFTHTQCNPMTFNNTSVNGFNYSWNFGDLSGSILASPTHTYAQAGFYLVTLTGNVPNLSGPIPCVLTDTAHIEIPLAAKFDVVAGCNGEPVCFTDRSTFTAGNNITSWSWNFGDASTSPMQSPCHTYAGPGTYTVMLTVSNGVCTDVYTLNVVVPNPPTAAFTFTNPNCINNPVNFLDASFASINYWNWAFGDAGTSLNQNPAHTYTIANIYPVTLIVHNIYGCPDTVQQNVNISNPSLSGNITASPDTIVCAGTPVLLVAPACATCTYLWSTGATNDSITVTTTGIYTVTITDANGCPYTTFIRIIVNNGPPAMIQNNGQDDLCLGEYTSLQVPFNTNWTYYWISNDGVNNGNTSNIINVYPAVPGSYTYQVAITDTSTGCSDTSLVYKVRVHALPVTPTITAVGPSIVCQGDTVTLVGAHPDPTTTHHWNTGDVTDTLLVTVNGCYQFKVTDTFGCVNQTSFCATVNPLPELCPFYVGCFDTCSPFTILGPPNGATYQWLLNGGIIAGATQQNYTANLSGAYQVIVSNVYGCTDTTGILNLTLRVCDSLCAHLDIDSIQCDSTGMQVIYYHVVNNSGSPLTQVNLEILQPNLNVAYAPNINFVNIAAGATSPELHATVYNAQPGQVLCYRAHVSEYDSTGHELMCCYTDTDCVTVPPCHQDTNCCYFHFIRDSITCHQSPNGTQYNFIIKINGCGALTIQSPNNGILNVANPYTLTPGVNTITGSYISNTDSVLCLTFVVSHNGASCADTTICFRLHCDQQPLPCLWDYNRQVCAGSNAPFSYYGNIIGVTVTWSFPGGVPSTASGPGPHSINYPTPGVYPFSMTLTNVNGSHTCTDSITVIAAPVASITQQGNTLNAYPAGMSYQWYNGPNLIVINGATNQFYNPPVAGIYCVMVSDNFGCHDSACTQFTLTDGIMELDGSEWNVYPNPNDGSFTLSIDMNKTGPAEMQIVNTLGEIVDQRVFDLNSGTHQFFISNKSISAGIYSVQLKTQNATGVKRMIVK